MAKSEKNFIKVVDKDNSAGMLYCLGILGAAVYFVGQVDGFWNIITALLKAFVWPAIVLYRALQLMQV